MEQITVKVPEDTNESLEAYADAKHDGNRSEAIRELLARGLEYDDLEDERDRLQRQLTATNARNDDVDTLAQFAEDERERRRRQDRREDALASAPPWRRFKWWATGTDPADTVAIGGEETD